MDLIFIHGRDQQGTDPAVLKSIWENTLAEGLRKAGLSRPRGMNIAMPYYGDELIKIMDRIDGGSPGTLAARGPKISSPELDFKKQFLQELADQAKVRKEDVEAELSTEVRERGPLQWEWVQGLLRVLDKTCFGGLSLDKFTHDVFVYLNYPTARKIVDDLVMAALPVDRSCVVVGHSLGSVVGFNVLRNAHAPCQVERYVTVGSPLGVRAVLNKLTKPIKMPVVVKDWRNAFDIKDVVALRELNENVFPTIPPITNYGKVHNSVNANHHGITGYLNDPVVAKWIQEVM